MESISTNDEPPENRALGAVSPRPRVGSPVGFCPERKKIWSVITPKSLPDHFLPPLATVTLPCDARTNSCERTSYLRGTKQVIVNEQGSMGQAVKVLRPRATSKLDTSEGSA